MAAGTGRLWLVRRRIEVGLGGVLGEPSHRIKDNVVAGEMNLSVGHASIQTTERYLGVRQDLHDAPCDRLGLDILAP